MNILKLQDGLKNLSDEQLAQEMRLPSGSTPQYLIMTEMQRREKMRAEFSGSEPPKTTMAEEMSGEAPPEQPAPPQGDMPPDGSQDANAQGLMGMPDETMAGNAMRARISGQPQQIDGMTALPPQTMAAGGAVQFGNPFAGAQMGSSLSSTGYAPIQHYTYTPPPLPEPVAVALPIKGGQRGGQGLNTRVHTVKPTAQIRNPLSVPATSVPVQALAAPARGAPTQNRGPIRRASDGGSIYADDGPIHYDGSSMPNQGVTAPTDFSGASSEELLRMMADPSPATANLARQEAMRRNSETRLGRGMSATGKFLGDYVVPGIKGASLLNPLVPLGKAAGSAYDYLTTPVNPQIPLPQVAVPEKPTVLQKKLPLPDTGASPKPAPPAAAVSGAPKPEDGGLAALLQQPSSSKADEFMQQARDLLEKNQRDPEKDRQTDVNNALMQFGLAMANSKSPGLFAAAAEGGLPALEQYNKTREGRRKDERALTADQIALLGTGATLSQAELRDAHENAIALDRARRENAQAQFEQNDLFNYTKQKDDADRAALSAYRSAGVSYKEYKAALDYVTKAEQGMGDVDPDMLDRAKQIVLMAQSGMLGGGGGGGGSNPDLDAELAKRGL